MRAESQFPSITIFQQRKINDFNNITPDLPWCKDEQGSKRGNCHTIIIVKKEMGKQLGIFQCVRSCQFFETEISLRNTI